MAVIVAWAVTFTVVFTLFMCLGFGPFGIIPGESGGPSLGGTHMYPGRLLRASVLIILWGTSRNGGGGLSVLGVWRVHAGGRHLCHANQRGHGGVSDARGRCCCGRRRDFGGDFGLGRRRGEIGGRVGGRGFGARGSRTRDESNVGCGGAECVLRRENLRTRLGKAS